MKNRKYLILLFLSLLVVSFCCENKSNILHAQGNAIMPLTVGNIWAGRIRIDSLGTTLNTTYDTLRIVKDTIMNNRVWFVANNGLNYYRSDSMSVTVANIDENFAESTFLRFPGYAGLSWALDTTIVMNINTKVQDTVITSQKLFQVDTSITVPAGTYSCVSYIPQTKKLDGTPSDALIPSVGWLWFSPGNGLIKFVYIDPSDEAGNRRIIWESTYIYLNE